MRYLGPSPAALSQREYNNTALLAAGCSYCPGSQATPAHFFFTKSTKGVYLLFYSSCSIGICDWGVGAGPSLLCVSDKGVIFGVGGFQISDPCWKYLKAPLGLAQRYTEFIWKQWGGGLTPLINPID
jgi:hypothetical protein